MAVMDIIIRAIDQASNVIDKIGAAGADLDKKFSSVTGTLDATGAAMLQTGRSLSLGITAPLAGLSTGLIKTGVQFKAFQQESRQAFGILLGSSELAIEHMDKILAFARTTPFAFPDLVSANRLMVSFGMAAEDTYPVMDAIANAVAAMGGGAHDLQSMADIFARIQSQGRLTGMELQRLGMHGINAVAILANKAGISVEEMRKAISKGAIDSKTAMDWLVDGIMHGSEGIAGTTVALGGSLGALKATWAGALDSMRGAWRWTADAVVNDDLFGKVIEGIHKLTDVIKKLPDLIGPLAESIGNMFIKLVNFVSNLIDKFFNLNPAIQQVIIKFIAILTALGPVLLIGGKLILMVSSSIKAFSLLFKTVGTVINIVTVAARGIRLLSAAIQSGVLVQKLAALATKAWTAAQTALNVALTANPIGLIIVGIAALIAAIIVVVKYWDLIKEKVLSAYSAFKNWFDNLPMWAKVLLSIVAPILLVIANIEKIYEVVKGAYKAFKEWHDNLPMWAKVLLSIVAPIITVIANIEKIVEVTKKAWTAISEFFGWGAKNAIDEVTEMGGKAVGEVAKMSFDIESKLLSLKTNGSAITEEFANEVINNSTRMKEMAVAKIEEQYTETLASLEFLRDQAGIITQDQYDTLLEIEENRKNDLIQNQEELNKAVIDKITELKESGVEVTAEMRSAIEKEIFAQRDAVIEAVAEQDAEVSLILAKLRHSSDGITKEMASEAIKNSILQRDQTIENAEEMYEGTIKAINSLSDESIATSGKTREQLIEEAKDTRDGVVKKAEEMHEGAVLEIMKMGKNLEGEIDTSTGKILTGWDKIVNKYVETNLAVEAKKKEMWQSFVEFATKAEETRVKVIGWFLDLPKHIGEAFVSVGEWIGGFLDSFKKLPEIVHKFFTEDLPSMLEFALRSILRWAIGAAESFSKFFIEDLPYMLGFALGTIVKWIMDAIKWFATLPGEIGKWLSETYENIKQWAIDTGISAYEAGKEFLENVINFIKDLPENFWNWLVKTWENIIKWKDDAIEAAKKAGREFLDNVINFIKNLPGNFWNWLVKTWENIIKWKDDIILAAKDAGKKLVDGFIDWVKTLPDKLWGWVKLAADKVLEIGGTLWNNAKAVANNFWEGFKKGLGIASPSYIERAIDDIAERASKLPGEVNTNFQKLKGIKLSNVFENEKIQIEGVANTSQSKQNISALRERGIVGESRGIEKNLSPITIHLHIGTFIGDKAGLKKLERMLREIRIEENSRMDFAFSGGVGE